MPNEVSNVDRVTPESAPRVRITLTDLASKHAGLSWPLLVGACVYVYLLIKRQNLLGDPDTYWHIAAGRWIIQHRAVFETDPFSHTMPGVAWMAHEWLSEVIFALAHQAGGWAAIVALTALAFAITLAFLTRFLLRYLEPIHALAFVGLAMGMALPHMLARPFALATPILVFWIAKMVEAQENQRTPSLWLLPLMTLWVNLFGGFTIGLAFTFALAAEAVLTASSTQERMKAARNWGIFFLLAVACALVTPNGVQSILYTLSIFSGETLIEHIGEWRSPNFHHFQPMEIWILTGFGFALYTGIKLPLIRLLLLLGLIHLGLAYARCVELLGFLGPLVVAGPLAAQIYRNVNAGQQAQRLDKFFRALAKPAKSPTTIVLMASLMLGTVILARNAAVEPENKMSPIAAVEAAKRGRLEGPVFNHYNFGGYLIYSGIPTFIDGRSEMFGTPFVKAYLETFKSRDKLQSLLDQYRTEWTLLPAKSPQIALMDTLPEWQQFHTDDIAVIHIRKTPLKRE